MIAEESHPDANIIWGTTLDPSLEDEMRITIIATGFDQTPAHGLGQMQRRPISRPVTEPVEAVENAPESEPALVTPVEQAEVIEPSITLASSPEEIAFEQLARPLPRESEPAPTPSLSDAISATTIETPTSTSEAYDEYDTLFTFIKKTKRNS